MIFYSWRQRHAMTADGIICALTWRSARYHLAETVGLWALYSPKGYFDDRHCGNAVAWVADDDIVSLDDLSAWTATAVGCPVDLESVDPPPRPFGDPAIETRFWVRRAS